MTERSMPSHSVDMSRFGETHVGVLLGSSVSHVLSSAAVAICGPHRRHGVVAATDVLAARVMEIEADLGEGPGWVAARTVATVVVHLNDSRKLEVAPVFATAARALGVCAIVACPLQIGRSVIGVQLGVSSIEHIDAQEIARFEDVAAATARLVVSDNGIVDHAIDARLHQASGMFAVEQGVSPDDALVLMRAHAFASGTSVADVAATVLHRYSQPISTL